MDAPADIQALVTQITHLLAALPTQESKLAVLERVRSELVATTLTLEMLEARQYTLVMVVVDDNKSESFLVSARPKAHALILAQKYVDERGFKLKPWNDGVGPNQLFQLFPGIHIREARKLFAAGKYI
jgi:hypothetical protein